MEAPFLQGRNAKKLPIKQLPRSAGRVTSEQRYWKSFKYPITSKYPSAITSVAFSPAEPHDFVVASGTVLYIYDPMTNDVKRSISQFKQNVRCVAYRPDGKLLVAGGDDNRVQLFNVSSRGILRSFRDHKGSVQDVRFLENDDTRVVSVSEDKTLRLFDIPTETMIHTFLGHQDYVRCVRSNPSSPHIVATASYDHTVRLWDLRTKESVTTFDYDHPVEKLEFFPSGAAFAATASNGVVLRDVLTGKIISTLTNHQKTATSLCFDGSGSRLFTGSLDHQVKIYDLETYSVVHSIKYAAPILDLGISKTNSHLVVGMSDGTMSIRRKEENSEEKEKNVSTFHAQHHRVQNYEPAKADFHVPKAQIVKFKPYEQKLRRFMYKEALDSVLSDGDPTLVISLIQELLYRRAVSPSLVGRNNQELVPILNFLYDYILNPRYNTHLFIVFESILDLYAKVFGRAPVVDELIMKINGKINAEKELQKKLFQLLGSLELVMTTTGLHK